MNVNHAHTFTHCTCTLRHTVTAPQSHKHTVCVRVGREDGKVDGVQWADDDVEHEDEIAVLHIYLITYITN